MEAWRSVTQDVLKRDMKYTEVDAAAWEQTVLSRSTWRKVLHQSIMRVKEKRAANYRLAHARRHSVPSASDFSRNKCKSFCRSRACLEAHQRASKNKPTWLTHTLPSIVSTNRFTLVLVLRHWCPWEDEIAWLRVRHFCLANEWMHNTTKIKS